MKWILLIVVLAPLGHGETTRSYVAGESREYNNYSPQAANQVYYTQPANNQYQVSSSGYSGYGGYANYPGVQLKQESSNYGTDLLSFGDGNDNAGEDSLGAIGGTVGAIAAAVGLKHSEQYGEPGN
ncbi:unnamed protein product [Allacma fusca]|uniref:Uncharacterized protein n=1 Tax=Allacma fusca TaxID=39272 RepID=A0A8J2P3Q8_9HEXA|nr:unnamed protein product [Allacma fusca]